MEDHKAEGNLESRRVVHNVPEGKNDSIVNWTKNHLCGSLAKTPAAFVPSLKSQAGKQMCLKMQTRKSNIQIQCNTRQNPNSILHRVRKTNYQIHLEQQITQDS